jgi:hypothetical protein
MIKMWICPKCGEPLTLMAVWSRTPMLGHPGNYMESKCNYSRMAMNEDLEGSQLRGTKR